MNKQTTGIMVLLASTVLSALLLNIQGSEPGHVLVEAEAFADLGGWYLEGQFVDQMGSAYLMAHGLGTPVPNARTTVEFPAAGSYRVWVRCKDWVPTHHPGRFRLIVDGQPLAGEFGADGKDWHWQDGGVVQIAKGRTHLELQDLTGFNGRCDAIYFTTGDDAPPDRSDDDAYAWRRKLLGLPQTPPSAGTFDVVVVGGGVPGCAAALAAARLGCRVALINNRPVLGGNASSEVGILPRGQSSVMVAELVERDSQRAIVAEHVLRGEKNITLFLNWHAYAAGKSGQDVAWVAARHHATHRELRFEAPVFIDCTGRAAVGMMVGADVRSGREARSEFDEPHAPLEADRMHHGHTIMFNTRLADSPVAFPDVPWARELSGDFAKLGGQTVSPGRENRAGPGLGEPHPTDSMTHYWEYGQWLDSYTEFENIRDHLLRALIGTFSTVKQRGGPAAANLEFGWVSPVLATGEWNRLVGDYILTERDIQSRKVFPDAVALNAGFICLHYPHGSKHDFRLGDWQFVPVEPYTVPLRSLYSRNIGNLMMAGKHISATHVAAASTKFILNGAQCGVATGATAYLCMKYQTTPRGVYEKHLSELQDIVADRGEYAGALRNKNPKPNGQPRQAPE